MSIKNLNGTEPATFRFVAQHLNHCATAVPNKQLGVQKHELTLVFERYVTYITLSMADTRWRSYMATLRAGKSQVRFPMA